VDSVTDYAIVMLDAGGHVVSWNPGAERIKGYTKKEIMGKHFGRFYPAEDAKRGLPEQDLKKAIKTGRFESEVQRVREDGTQFWANVILSPLRDQDGTVRGFAKATRDLTELKRVQEVARLANVYTRSLIEASLDPLMIIRPDGKITDLNGATEAVTGRTRKQLIGTEFLDYFTEPEKARAGYQEIFRKGSVVDLPLELRHSDGHVTSVLFNASVYRDEAGEVIGISAVARDISERKLAEARIQQQAREIRELSTPVMQVWQGVVVAPLIGSLDSRRTQEFMERLLDRVVATNSPVALVDIQGVPTVDTQTGQHLIETVAAVRLLGAQVVLTGVRPAIAQTLIHLGIDLSGIITRSSLAAGLLVAFDLLNLHVVGKTDSV
jgi:rsbT co-antagonist protein RsbR